MLDFLLTLVLGTLEIAILVTLIAAIVLLISAIMDTVKESRK